jgi:Rrf2 family protein
MKIARETDYAIRCLLFMAGNPVKNHTVGQIARSREIPQSFLAKILQKLVRAGILTSARGTGGGFRLSRNPGEITLLQVIEAIEGPLAVNDCFLENRTCSMASRCGAHAAWKEIRKGLAADLGRYTLRRLMDLEKNPQPSPVGIAGEAP